MITFKDYFTQDGNKIVAIYPGGFKPPTKGHFKAFKYLMEQATEGLVYIGKGVRDNITADQSFKIWNIYKDYLNKPVNIEISAISPVRSVCDYVDQNLDDNNFKSFLVGAGSKGNDVSRYRYFEKNIEKYAKVQIVQIPIQENNISGTKTRELINNKDNFALNYFVPECLSKEDKNKVARILNL
tara:strand:- start:9954 stop:10505 length:552 start_codon:yes stop_codon:yes gene_type:complete